MKPHHSLPVLGLFYFLFMMGAVVNVNAESKPTAAEAEAFMNKTEARLAELAVKVNQATWVQSNFITEDTQALAAAANDEYTALTTELVEESKKYDGVKMSPELARKFMLLRLSLTAPAPKDAKLRREMTELGSWLEGEYGKGKYCRKGADGKEECLDITAIEQRMAESRDPNELLELWRGWHAIAPHMRDKYTRFVDLSNQGARELGLKDVGVLWRGGYDMKPEEFSAELDHLYDQLKPLYLSLHTYVRTQLSKHYGPGVVPPNGPIPAHLLGNIWAQQWGNVYPLLNVPEETKSFDTTELLKKKNLDAKGMVKYGENFFKSMGFAPLPDTFWERSLFVKPKDRDVVCHASAWDIDNADDLRIKMCINVNEEDFVTIHHELGHNFYQRAYKHQPFLFQNGANDGFHEAIGDAIALAITPEYLHKVGLLEEAPKAGNDVPLLMKQALDRVAFVPFGLLIDQWRWKVFSGEIKPADYNKAWWELRKKYQGVAPPEPRGEEYFDPAAKYHVAGNVPYMRYFLAHVLEFQFYRALCRESGYSGPLHRCTFFGSKEAGAKFNKMLEMGQSKPWPDALEALTGQRHMDAGAMLEYFAPLQQWLDEQNKGQKQGW